MLVIPSSSTSLLGHKRNLQTITCLAQLSVLILCFLVHSTSAGVIKKRATEITVTQNGNSELPVKETEVEPTVIMAVNNDSLSITTTRTTLQPLKNISNLAAGTSKELTNNEILLNEANKLLVVGNIIEKSNNETLFKENATYIAKNLQQIIQPLENKPQTLEDETAETTTEFRSNHIKDVKISKLVDKQIDYRIVYPFEENNNSSSFKTLDKTKAPSKILEEPKTEREPIAISKKQLDNNIENSEEYIKDYLKLKGSDEVTNAPLELINSSMIANSEVRISQSKPLEHSTSLPAVTESLKVSEMSTTVPSTDSKNDNQIQSLDSVTESYNILSPERKSKQSYNDSPHPARLKTTPKYSIHSDETTLKPITKEKDVLSFDTNNQENVTTSLLTENSTTIEINDIDELTTIKPVILSIKHGIENTEQGQLNTQIEDFSKNVKEKKPKFINDNSTNAQQLNLPNNAEVWSLAGMKTLPKPNITMATMQTHNQTQKELHHTTLNLNNNSEKNLLDWSQIMMDKELSTTARNDNTNSQVAVSVPLNKTQPTAVERKESIVQSTTLIPDTEVTHYKLQPGVDVITQNSLVEQDSTTSTITPAPMATILSSPSLYNENDNKNSNQPDKKVEENMNNHIDMLTANGVDTSAAANVNNNNPFNASLNIEPNLHLSEINLTSNQTQVDLNNDVQTIKAAENKKTAEADDVNAANTFTETSILAAMMTTTMPLTPTTPTPTTPTSTSTSTSTTAVVDMATVEQISSETTTVSTLETSKQNVSLLNSVITSEQQQQQQNKNNSKNVIKQESNISLSTSQNELENTVRATQTTQYEDIDLNTKATTRTTSTVVPITTYRPAILATTSTTSTPIATTLEQEVDQNGNEIQTNLTKTEQQQQSIIETDNHSTKAFQTHSTAREFETTTLETFTTTSTTTPPAELTTARLETTVASLWENETNNTTTSSSSDVIINETSEINLTATTTQTTPKQKLDEQKNIEDKTETTTGSAVVEDEKFENENKIATTTPTYFSSNSSTETPVVIKSITPTTPTTTVRTTITTVEQNTIATTIAEEESFTKENISYKEDAQIETTTQSMNNTQEFTTTTTAMPSTAVKEEDPYISLLDDTTTTTTTATYSSSISATSHESTTSETTATTLSSSTLPSTIATKVEEIYNAINSSITTTELIQTTTQQLLTEIEKETTSSEPESTSITATSASSYFPEMLPPATTTQSTQLVATADIGKSLPTLTASIMGGNSGNMYPKNSEASGDTDVNVIIAITVSVIGVIALVLLVGFLYLMRKRQKQTSYSQRCRPVSLDEYTIDNASVSGSMRKSGALRASKRTYGNLAFDDPALRPNPLGVHDLAKFVQEKLRIFEEFRDVPQITSRLDEVPTGCEDKNRYANVLPLPETRVILQRLNDDEKSEYINANYVTGPKDTPNYYIACQAPLEATVEDFWRMIWEQQSRVIIQATDLIEIGIEKCAEYLPPSVTLDNHCSFGDFQITLQNREVKDKYAISTIQLKHVGENAIRELTHYWYKWPEVGVPNEEAPIIAMLLEARSSLISYAIEQANEDKEKLSTGTLKSAEEGTATLNDSTTSTNNSNGSSTEINGNISAMHIKKAARNQGPLTIHCSPGTGRTGTIIACDVAIRSLETPKRTVDIPQIVYYVRRGRASAVLTKEQYEFIYKVASMYAAKITNPTNYN